MDLNELISGEDELLSSLLTMATECFVVLDEKGCIREANSAFCKLLGYPHAELLGKQLEDLISTADHPDFEASWLSLMQTRDLTGEWRIQDHQGRLRLMEMNFFHQQKDTIAFVCLFCREIKQDAEARELNALRNHALAAAANAMVITDAEGHIVWVNHAFCAYTGYSLEEAIDNTPSMLLKSGRHPDSFYQDMWDTIKRGDIWQGEIINRRKDGSLYPEEMTITPMFNDIGVITHYIAVKQDISEKKNLQEMFLRAQRLESVGTMASGVAHDLNNVLAPILMSADILMLTNKDPKTLEVLQVIKDSSKRGANIVRQLLSFVRGGSDEKTEIQLRHILKDVIKIFRETFPKFITIDEHISADLIPVFGDATRLSQVFTNLMINARDAMPEGGTLRVDVKNVYLSVADALNLKGATAGHYVRIRIKDDGIGIPEPLRENIFQSFYTTKDIGLGTGLGLPTSLQIIKQHKGFLTLESEVGKGSVFDVYFPVYKGALPVKDQSASHAMPQGAGEHILVIDDEVSVGNMLKGTLKALNYTVTVCNSGQAGLDWWHENRENCSLILLDMLMPGMDGLAVCKALKQAGSTCPLMVMSGMVSGEKLIKTGIDITKSFIPKPFTISDLAVKIHEHLPHALIADD